MKSERAWKPVSPPPGAPAPVGNFSLAVTAGDLVFVSGQIPLDASTGTIQGDATFESQVRLVFDNLGAVLDPAGACLGDVISVSVFLADIADWGEFNRIFGEVFQAPYPTRTVVGANLEGFRVEASAVALRRPA